jgi:hypothetical protein
MSTTTICSYRALLQQAADLAAGEKKHPDYIWWEKFTRDDMPNYLSPQLTRSALPKFFWPKGRRQPSSMGDDFDGDNASSVAGTGRFSWKGYYQLLNRLVVCFLSQALKQSCQHSLPALSVQWRFWSGSGKRGN